MSLDSNSKTTLTYEDYRKLPDDGRRHEIIEGELFVNPAPGTYHQSISGRLCVQLHVQVERRGRGRVFCAPTDLRLSSTCVVQPDLLVLTQEQESLVTPELIDGAPQLVVEILSPSTSKVDLGLKKELYRRFGIPEYWIVDPVEQVVQQYHLCEGRYELLGSHAEGFAMASMPEVEIDLSEVW